MKIVQGNEPSEQNTHLVTSFEQEQDYVYGRNLQFHRINIYVPKRNILTHKHFQTKKVSQSIDCLHNFFVTSFVTYTLQKSNMLVNQLLLLCSRSRTTKTLSPKT